MAGRRARVGYCSPMLVTETFLEAFARVAPTDVGLMITTLSVGDAYSAAAFEDSWSRAMAGARAMAAAGADVVVLGGNPINQRQGVENLPRITAELTAELGVPVVTSTQAQQDALRALGATRVAAAHLSGPDHDARVSRQIEAMGVQCAGVLSHDAVPLLRYATVGDQLALDLGRQLQRRFPDADALHFPNAHWPVVGSIEQLERETGVAVSGAAQAIIWKALRLAGIEDRIDGFGRLLRDA